MTEIVPIDPGTSKSTGTIRTAVPAAWSLGVAWLLDELDIDVLDGMPDGVKYPLILGAFTLAYRIGRELEGRWPWFGRIFFGRNKPPLYPKETA